MLATILKPPEQMSPRQVEYISKIIDVLSRLFGSKKIQEKDFVRRYVEYPDGRVKRVEDLATKLAELKDQELRENYLQLEDEDIRLPGEVGPS